MTTLTHRYRPSVVLHTKKALPANGRLLHPESPLCLPVILTGVKIAVVINVGTATLAAFIRASGYGERIVGLALHDNAMPLAGAIRSAALALITTSL